MKSRPVRHCAVGHHFEQQDKFAQAQEALRVRSLQFEMAINKMSQGLSFFDGEDRLVVWNSRYVEMYGLAPERIRVGITRQEILDLRIEVGSFPAMSREEFLLWRSQIAIPAEPSDTIVPLRTGRIFKIHHCPMPDGGWVATHEDITEQERVKAALAEQSRRFDTALNNMSQGLLMVDSDERILVCNDRYIEMYGLSREVVKPGCSYIEFLRYRARQGLLPCDPDQYRAAIMSELSSGKTISKTARTGDGREILQTIRPVANGGWIVTHEDITEQREAQAKIAHMALHDALTNLPNRLAFRERLEDRLAHLEPDHKFAVLCLDLDRFKSVNDTLGHPYGDMLLRQVAERLRSCLRECDTIARFGGDEFAILQLGIGQPIETTVLAARLIDVVETPFDLDGHQVVVGLSVGIAVAPTDAVDPDRLLKNADMALYRAKGDGRGTYRFFEPEMDARMQARRALEIDLRKALINKEFVLYYQPLINLQKEEICGFEALIRWNHPERGIISPLEFIPLAEETGLIVPIGEWVLHQACEEAVKWPGDLSIAVNLSPIQFKMPNLSLVVTNALARSGLKAQRLELEITESVLLLNSESTLATLHQLRKLGVRISMDDFGTGYSSLSYLRSFPFDKIKIDASFVRHLSSNADSMAIIRAITGLGGSLGIKTTGEGVETEEELDYLKQEGCTEAQGFYFSQPRPASEVHKLLAGHAVPAKAAA
jgi:diguanylate cyclase (GGDEF)-like protein